MSRHSTKIFSFQSKQAGKFKKALEALSDSNLNAKDWAIVDMDPREGFKVSVGDAQTGNFSYVWSKPNVLSNFQCKQPLKNKKVNLKFMVRLAQGIHDDIIDVYLTDSMLLNFKYGTRPGLALGLNLLENAGEVEPYSGALTQTCKAILPTQGGLSDIIPEMVKDGYSQLVSMDIISTDLKISIGKKDWEFKSVVEVGENALLASGESYHVEFLWSRIDSLMKASSLAAQCSLCLLSSNDIMLKFDFEEGSLVYIKQPVIFVHHACNR